MSAKYEVISTFLDGEPFASQELVNALSEPVGRDLLIDLVTLRRLVQPNDVLPSMGRVTPARRFGWRAAVAAASLLATLAGGYLAGQHQASIISSQAPPPTRVVHASPFVPAGGLQ